MSVSTPLRRVAPRCLCYRPRTAVTSIVSTQRRSASSAKDKDINVNKPANPTLEKYMKENSVSAEQISANQQAQQRELMRAGDISSSSIFEDDQPSGGPPRPLQQQDVPLSEEGRAMVLDPDPNSRERWERKKVIQAIRKGGRMTRVQMLKRTEREHLSKSENMKTSVKKLGMLARQIAGKSLEDAIVQMRFSKKKAAQQILQHLEASKNEAIVAKGMALGSVKKQDSQDAAEETDAVAPALIRRKDGSKYKVTDPSKMYIDQAWVGRGKYGKLLEFRARGRVNVLRTPFTSLSVLLKEEKTLVREHKDREERRQKRREARLWHHLPDRPLLGPRSQYYCW